MSHIINQHSDLIIKPSKDTNSGRGVYLINDKLDKKELEVLLSSYPSDFIIQKKVEQSEFTAQFNETSVNTFRIVTLFINNKISLCYGVLKLGSFGRIVDNGANGGLWVGIDKDGKLNDWGTDFKLQFSSSHNGVSLKGQVIPNYHAIVDLAFEAHMHIPTCGLVAWDIALDLNNAPLLIEANLWWPSTSYGEICNGPAFGDRTDEVIDFVHRRTLPTLGFLQKV